MRFGVSLTFLIVALSVGCAPSYLVKHTQLYQGKVRAPEEVATLQLFADDAHPGQSYTLELLQLDAIGGRPNVFSELVSVRSESTLCFVPDFARTLPKNLRLSFLPGRYSVKTQVSLGTRTRSITGSQGSTTVYAQQQGPSWLDFKAEVLFIEGHGYHVEHDSEALLIIEDATGEEVARAPGVRGGVK